MTVRAWWRRHVVDDNPSDDQAERYRRSEVVAELTSVEVMVLQDAVAAELARYLMYEHDSEEFRRNFDALEDVGRKIGMQL